MLLVTFFFGSTHSFEMSHFITSTTCSVFTSSTSISSLPFGTIATTFNLVVTSMLFLTLHADVCFSDQSFDFGSDDFFEMLSLGVNGDSIRAHLILLDLMFQRLTVLISVLWWMNDAELVP